MPLVEVNEHVHRTIEAGWTSFVEHVLAGEYGLAAGALRRFMDSLNAHMEAEEAHALPAFRRCAGAGNAVLAQVEGDHVILRRAVADVARVLEELAGAGSGQRRLLASRLGPLNRVREVLEHHSQRERERFYPVLDASLDADARELLGLRLQAGISER